MAKKKATAKVEDPETVTISLILKLRRGYRGPTDEQRLLDPRYWNDRVFPNDLSRPKDPRPIVKQVRVTAKVKEKIVGGDDGQG